MNNFEYLKWVYRQEWRRRRQPQPPPGPVKASLGEGFGLGVAWFVLAVALRSLFWCDLGSYNLARTALLAVFVWLASGVLAYARRSWFADRAQRWRFWAGWLVLSACFGVTYAVFDRQTGPTLFYGFLYGLPAASVLANLFDVPKTKWLVAAIVTGLCLGTAAFLLQGLNSLPGTGCG